MPVGLLKSPRTAKLSFFAAALGIAGPAEVRMDKISKKYDELFERYGGKIPVPFLRALAYSESSLRPDATTPSSNATGLFQQTKVVVDDFNKRYRTSYKLEDFKDPALSTKAGTDLLKRIVDLYAKFPTLAVDWSDPRSVALVVQGYNSGYAGVAMVARAIEEAAGVPEDVTVDAVMATAPTVSAKNFPKKPAGESPLRFLHPPFPGNGMRNSANYAKLVAARYLNELGMDARLVLEGSRKGGVGRSPWYAALAAAVAGVAVLAAFTVGAKG